ncbi:MAG: tRNA lysidine(34) synthetase TilS [Gammaproteobacteria bacterium]|nr:MAG: tRNA lysidine(34) synthetase TilS [Gammaproteobacteria bacterium]
MTLQEAIRDFCSRYGFEKTYWVAYSGGLDSHVLLAICHELRQTEPLQLRAIHINHGIHPHAHQWAAHCAKVCVEMGIDYHERAIQLELPPGTSLEEAARKQRYAILAEDLNEGDILLTAHHQDDQAETVLLQLFRGAGPKGLAAMPRMKPFGRGFHGRPLLDFPRATLEQYAATHSFQWIEDDSNRDTSLTRNFIRHELLSLLKTRWPTVTQSISRSAAYCAEAQGLLEEWAKEEWQTVQGSRDNTLSVSKLLALDVARQRLFLRLWIQQLGHPLPDAKKLDTIQYNVLTAKPDRQPCVRWQQTEIRRYRDDLYLMKALPPAAAISTRRGSHTLKRLFQEWGIPPWERNRLRNLLSPLEEGERKKKS